VPSEEIIVVEKRMLAWQVGIIAARNKEWFMRSIKSNFTRNNLKTKYEDI
jgi:hypothetical protein